MDELGWTGLDWTGRDGTGLDWQQVLAKFIDRKGHELEPLPRSMQQSENDAIVLCFKICANCVWDYVARPFSLSAGNEGGPKAHTGQ